MTDLRGATVLLTGATGGLGRVIATALAGQGGRMVLTGRRPEPLAEAAAAVRGRAVLADLSRRSDLYRLLDEAGPIDIFVANAALPASGPLTEWSRADADRAMELNLLGPIAATQALLPDFLARGSGHFVYISSLSGKVASPGTALYSAAKFGLRGFAGGLRGDLAGTTIGCSVVSPGFVADAGMFADTGLSLPLGVGGVSSRSVGRAVVRAIRTNRAEITVAPLPLRIGSALGSLAPGLSSRVQSRFGGDLSERIVRAQTGRR